MATVTPLNNWPVPTSTDLVKDGAVAIESLGDAIDASVGSGLLAWQSYTPTFVNFNIGVGGTITRAKYAKIGKIVHMDIVVSLGAGSSVSGRIGISLPVTAAYNFSNPVTACDLTAGAANANGIASQSSTTQIDLYALLASGTYVTRTNVSSTIPGTWATGSSFALKYTYEAA
jgi:hypothetical protein